MKRHERALREIVNVLGPQICSCARNPDCGLADEAHEALRVAREALAAQSTEDPDVLLDAWYDWWRTSLDAPAKMPNGLHVRTAIHLKYQELTEEHHES